MEESSAPEERILLAAIDLINEAGLAGATIRRIAERAQVNPAAISYYYRGKDSLLALALETTLKNAFDLADFAASANAGPHERLLHVLEGLVAGALRFPGIARAHFHAPWAEGRYDTSAVQRLNAFMDELQADLSARYAARGAVPDDLREALAAIVAATVLFAATLPGMFGDFSGPDLGDAQTRRRYLERVVRGLLP